MEFKLRKNNVLWNTETKTWEISLSGVVQNYIDNVYPDGKKLDEESDYNLELFIEDTFGYSLISRINNIKEYSNIKVDEFANVLKKRKLGKGAYATVYPLDQYLIVKIIKDKDQEKNGKTESRVYNFLNKNILFNKLVYCIPVL